ncbi:MAG: hypothetical protein OSJ27_07965, partial [Candidatus Gastranaerophilales bacterium]|nr:hypothetical protein [Candidatus Gastranaerophilales bacterium]
MLNLFIVLKGALRPKFFVPFKGLSESSSKLSFVKACAKAPCRTLFGAIIGAGYKILSLLAEFRFSKLRLFNSKAIAEKFKSYNRAGNKLPALAKPLCAFSLVEMLMALLVASLLLAALAPVMTKKFSENVSVFGAGGGGGRAPAGMKCWNWEAKDLNEINQRVVKDFQLDEVWYANFILASGGGGGAGATVSSEENDTMDINTANATTTGIKITKDMADFEITSLIGGGGGAGGGAAVFSGSTCSGAPSVEKCECMGQKFDSKNNLCVSDNLGSKNRSNAISACSALSPSGKWSVPTTSQLSKWSTLYSNFGITAGQTVWSQTTGTGSCASYGTTTYSCYCNGSYRSGYTSSSSCCSGCSYGSSSGLADVCTAVVSSSLYTPTRCRATLRCGTRTCTWDSETIEGGTTESYCASNASSWVKQYDCCNGSAVSKGSACGTNNSCSASSSTPCNSYYTNYYFYQLSGSSWTSSYSTSATDSRSTYCVYSDLGNVDGSRFYSLSGGGGGGAPAIQNNNFNSNIKTIFNQKIK